MRHLKNKILIFLNGIAVMGIVCGILCEIKKYSPWGIWLFMGSTIWLVLFLFVNYDLRYSDWGIRNANKYRKEKTKDTRKVSEVDRSVRYGGSANCRDLQDYVKERDVRSSL